MRKRGSLRIWAELWGHSYNDLEIRLEAHGFVEDVCINPAGKVVGGHRYERWFSIKDRKFIGKVKGREDFHFKIDLDRDFHKFFGHSGRRGYDDYGYDDYYGYRFDDGYGYNHGFRRCPGKHRSVRRFFFEELEFKIVDRHGRGYGYGGRKLAKAECWFDDYDYGYSYGYRRYSYDNRAICDIYY